MNTAQVYPRPAPRCHSMPPGYQQFPPRCRLVAGHKGNHEGYANNDGYRDFWANDDE